MKTKEALLESSKHHKLMIKNELSTISDKTTNVARKLLLIGSIAGGAYLLFKALSNNDETIDEAKNKEEKPLNYGSFSGITRFGKVLTHQLLLFILNESKVKIQEYLNEFEKDANNS